MDELLVGGGKSDLNSCGWAGNFDSKFNWKITFLSHGLGNTDEDFIFPSQCCRKGKEKEEGLHVYLKYEVLIHLLR